MPESPTTIDRLLDALQDRSPLDLAGWGAAAMGAVLVAVGVALQGQGADVGTAVRALGVVLLLGGIGVLVFGEPRRRQAVISRALGAVSSYLAATARWELSNRVGVGAMLIGLILLAPAVLASALFGTAAGTAIVAPGIVLFWGGGALMVYAWYRRYRERRDQQRWQQGRGPGRGRGPRGRGGRWRP